MVFCGPMWMGNCPLLYWSYFTHLQGKGIAFLSGGGCYRGSRRANLLSISTCLGLVRWGILIDIWCICFINLLTSCGGILICSNSLTECTWIAPLELFYTTYPVFKLGFDVSRNLRKLWKVKKIEWGHMHMLKGNLQPSAMILQPNLQGSWFLTFTNTDHLTILSTCCSWGTTFRELKSSFIISLGWNPQPIYLFFASHSTIAFSAAVISFLFLTEPCNSTRSMSS